jgi:hypothetical protein
MIEVQGGGEGVAQGERVRLGGIRVLVGGGTAVAVGQAVEGTAEEGVVVVVVAAEGAAEVVEIPEEGKALGKALGAQGRGNSSHLVGRRGVREAVHHPHQHQEEEGVALVQLLRCFISQC